MVWLLYRQWRYCQSALFTSQHHAPSYSGCGLFHAQTGLSIPDHGPLMLQGKGYSSPLFLIHIGFCAWHFLLLRFNGLCCFVRSGYCICPAHGRSNTYYAIAPCRFAACLAVGSSRVPVIGPFPLYITAGKFIKKSKESNPFRCLDLRLYLLLIRPTKAVQQKVGE